MKLTRSLAVVASVLTLSADTASAQMINFTTAGLFSGAGCTSVGGLNLINAWCDISPDVRVTYLYGAPQVLNGFGNAQFGSFVTSGMGPANLNNVFFTLTVTQTTPSPGNFQSSESVTGSVAAIQGGLIWGPIDPSTFMIGNISYTLVRDVVTNGVRIDPPGMNGALGDPQTIRGFVSNTVVPEPSTYLLMAGGLAAVAMFARRRRSE